MTSSPRNLLHELGPVVIQLYLNRGALYRHPSSGRLSRAPWPAAIKSRRRMAMSLPRGFSPSELLDGAATLAQAAAGVREYGYWLCALVDAWHELDGPILEDCGVYGAGGLALGRHDSGNTPGSVASRPRLAGIPK